MGNDQQDEQAKEHAEGGLGDQQGGSQPSGSKDAEKASVKPGTPSSETSEPDPA